MRAPLGGWTFTDILHVLLLIAVFVTLFIIPYLWILPIHYFGIYNRKRGIHFSSPFRWGLRPFWVVSFLMMSILIAGEVFFLYDETFFDSAEDFIVS
jgi:hypothetical protein